MGGSSKGGAIAGGVLGGLGTAVNPVGMMVQSIIPREALFNSIAGGKISDFGKLYVQGLLKQAASSGTAAATMGAGALAAPAMSALRSAANAIPGVTSALAAGGKLADVMGGVGGKALDIAGQGIKAVGNAIPEAVKSGAGNVANAIGKGATSVLDTAQKPLTALADTIRPQEAMGIDRVANVVNNVQPSALDTARTGVANSLSGYTSGLKQGVQQGMGTLKQVVGGNLKEGLTDFAKKQGMEILNKSVLPMATAKSGGYGDKKNMGREILTNLVGSLAGSGAGAIGNALSPIVSAAAAPLTSAASVPGSALSQMASKVTGMVGQGAQTLKDKLANTGIMSVVQNVTDTAQKPFSAMADFMKPSSVAVNYDAQGNMSPDPFSLAKANLAEGASNFVRNANPIETGRGLVSEMRQRLTPESIKGKLMDFGEDKLKGMVGSSIKDMMSGGAEGSGTHPPPMPRPISLPPPLFPEEKPMGDVANQGQEEYDGDFGRMMMDMPWQSKQPRGQMTASQRPAFGGY